MQPAQTSLQGSDLYYALLAQPVEVVGRVAEFGKDFAVVLADLGRRAVEDRAAVGVGISGNRQGCRAAMVDRVAIALDNGARSDLLVG